MGSEMCIRDRYNIIKSPYQSKTWLLRKAKKVVTHAMEDGRECWMLKIFYSKKNKFKVEYLEATPAFRWWTMVARRRGRVEVIIFNFTMTGFKFRLRCSWSVQRFDVFTTMHEG